MNQIKVDFSSPYGKVKLYNAVNNGPISSLRGLNNLESYREARIPYARLHDASFCSTYGGEWSVDVHRIFRDFDADENDPANYIFAPTDKYLADILSVGTKPYYRLGASIEHSHKFGTYPPKDYLKWARIAEHIIRHYTEGWADGFNYDIEYWEVWNEPDNYNLTGNPCWQGTVEQFADFFSVVCPYLKEKFPNLKIGGPAMATVMHDEWCDKFFSMIRDRGVKLDFISYHRYNKTVEDFVAYVRKANSIFERYGYGDLETHINEWNYIRGWRGEDFLHSVKAIKGIKGTAFTTGVICALHPEKLDMLMYYEGRPCGFCGLFDSTYYTPLKGYYPFIAYNSLLDLGTAVKSECNDYVYSLGATDGKNGAILLTYFNQEDSVPKKELKLSVCGMKLSEGERIRASILVLDETHDLECIREEYISFGDFDLYLDLPPYTTYLVKLNVISE